MTNDRYKIEGKLGSGGMASVFRGTDLKLGRPVAIKQMADDLEKDPAAVAAFDREAKILAGLPHPNIVMVYDCFEDEGHHFLVMEYVKGDHLGTLIRRGPTPLAAAIALLEQILSGIQMMHENGIVHQDLKPSNILLDTKGAPKITDFGLATATGYDGPTLNWASVQYLAPEVYTSGADFRPQPRQDIYALGIVMYELLLGEKAFRAELSDIYDGDSEIRQRWANWHQNPQRHFRVLSDIDPEIPTYVAQLVARMTSKDLARRYADVASILKDLHDKRQQDDFVETEDGDRTAPIAPLSKPAQAVLPQKSRKRRPTLLYAAAAVSILGSAALFLGPARDTPLPGVLTANPGAEVVVDGHLWGAIPPEGVIRGQLPKGAHTAKLMLADYEPLEAEFEIKASKRWTLKLAMKANPALPAVPPRIDTPSGAMRLVPAGPFLYDRDNRQGTLPAFYIDETEVTNAAYRKFCEATNHPVPLKPLWDEHYLEKDLYPVVNVTWDDAVAFAQWAGKRLPTELEWEKAARGTDGRAWPWGSSFDPAKANLGGSADGYEFAAPVGRFPAGASPYGVLDMAGNVWEWVADAYRPAKELKPKDRVVKGGAFVRGAGQNESAASFHGALSRQERPGSIGFRCAKDAPPMSAAPAKSQQP
jgi:eukaryotic-like serine/threonine-protein kinase